VVSVEEAATKMIQISDNTAADMLIGMVGRKNVEGRARRWTANASADEPFLTTREMFLLHYVAGPGDRYLATPRGQRDAILASSVEPLPLGAIASGISLDPRFAAPSPGCSGCRRTPTSSLVDDSHARSRRHRSRPSGMAAGLVRRRLGARRPHTRLARHEPSREDLRRRGDGVEPEHFGLLD
jgi:hypothetical protein